MGLYDDYAECATRFKAVYGERVLVAYEVGQFFEWYNCDQNRGCDVRGICELLNVTRTRRDKRVPEISGTNPELGGVPSHAFGKYLPVLLENDYTVVIVSQFNEGGGKFSRKVTDVLSKSTHFSEAGSAGETANLRYVAAVHVDAHRPGCRGSSSTAAAGNPNLGNVVHMGFAAACVSTGECFAREINGRPEDPQAAFDEAFRIVHEYNPAELAVYGNADAFPGAPPPSTTHVDEHAVVSRRLEAFAKRIGARTQCVYDRIGNAGVAAPRVQEAVLRRVFRDTGFLGVVEALDLERRPHACAAFTGLVQFVFDHNETALVNLRRPVVSTLGEDEEDAADAADGSCGGEGVRLMLSYNAASQLDVCEQDGGLGGGKRESTLCGVLNTCVTPVGRRYMRHQLLHPLTRAQAIRDRHCEVQAALERAAPEDPVPAWQVVRERALRGMIDLERLARKVALGRIKLYDLALLDDSLSGLVTLASEAAFALGLASARVSAQEAARLRDAYANVIAVGTGTNPNSSSSNGAARDESQPQPPPTPPETPTTGPRTEETQSSSAPPRTFLPGVDRDLDVLYERAQGARDWLDRIADAFNAVAADGKKFFRVVHFATSTSANAEGSSAADAVGTYAIVATPLRCETLRKAAASKRRVLFHDTPSEMDFQHVAVRPINSSLASVVHPVIMGWDQELRKALAALGEENERKFAEFVAAFWTSQGPRLQALAAHVAHLDFVCACARNARVWGHVRPDVSDEGSASSVAAVRLQHPVLQAVHENTALVPNDVAVGSDASCRGVLVYGMNAAGKSCLMKAVALAVLMAQAGMFVPCAELRVTPFRKIFTRIQSRDDIARGQSTFMVEMSELRNILRRCDARSLVIGDEVCSGTEAVSALSIVGSSVSRLLYRTRTPFLFATHLHELPRVLRFVVDHDIYGASAHLRASPSKNGARSESDSGSPAPGLRVCHLRVEYDPSTSILVYDRRLCEGQGPTVYGLEVCKALDMDPEFVEAAHAIRRSLLTDAEAGNVIRTADVRPSRYNAKVVLDACCVCGRNRAREVHHIRPQHDADENGFVAAADDRQGARYHKDAAFNLAPLCHGCHAAAHAGRLALDGYQLTSEGVCLRWRAT